MIRDTGMCAGQEENLSKGKLGSQMEHERPWSWTHGCIVSCVLVNQGSRLFVASFHVMAVKPSAL